MFIFGNRACGTAHNAAGNDMKHIDLSDEKLRNAAIFFVSKTRQVGITKLMKLLYFLDFRHYQETGFPVTGQTYRTWQFGPVPVDVWAELKERKDSGLKLASVIKAIPGDDEGALLIRPLAGVSFVEDPFSRRELRILNELAEIFRDVPAKLMVSATHAHREPWTTVLKTAGENRPISYELAFTGKESEEQMTRIRENQEEHNAAIRVIEAL